jgi:hypothetical protein
MRGCPIGVAASNSVVKLDCIKLRRGQSMKVLMIGAEQICGPGLAGAEKAERHRDIYLSPVPSFEKVRRQVPQTDIVHETSADLS